MDFELDDDERALQTGIRSFLDGRFPIDVVRSGEERGGAIDHGLWSSLGDIGIFSLRTDGFGMTESVLAFEELGRSLVAGPLVGSHLAATLIGGAGDGSKIVGVVEPSEPVTVVEHIDSIDHLVVIRDDGLFLVDPRSITATRPDRPLDALTPIGVVDALAVGQAIAGPEVAAAWRLDGMVLTSALQLGVCLATIDLARAYAMEREQFGRPIGSFQAVKHLLADMLVRAEVTRAAVYAAAVSVDGRGDTDGLLQTARMAKILAGDSALFCGKTCIQVHGGMGFTWEVDAQRYWKRACVLDTQFGNSDRHAEAFAEAS